MSINLSLADLPALLDTDDEECPPLIVEPPACSSQMVMGGMVPTITVSSSVAETTVNLAQIKSQGKHLCCRCSRKECVKGYPTAPTHFTKYCIG